MRRNRPSAPTTASSTKRTSARVSTTGSRADLDFQHLLIQEQQGVQRLRLRAGGHVALDRQVGQELFDLGGAQLQGRAVVVKVQEAPYPVEVAFLGSQGIMPGP
jgi:hypothetical protein